MSSSVEAAVEGHDAYLWLAQDFFFFFMKMHLNRENQFQASFQNGQTRQKLMFNKEVKTF